MGQACWPANSSQGLGLCPKLAHPILHISFCNWYFSGRGVVKNPYAQELIRKIGVSETLYRFSMNIRDCEGAKQSSVW